MSKQRRDSGWDFPGVNTREYTHGLHQYPAMMIPQVARRLVGMVDSSAKWLFDPFCGTGTSLVEGAIAGFSVCGTDLNPLARLISEVKTREYEIGALQQVENTLHGMLHNLSEVAISHRFDKLLSEEKERWQSWFPEETLVDIGRLVGAISIPRISIF